MCGKAAREKDGSKKLNVEIAPGNQMRLEVYMKSYNARPDRKTPRIKYTDVLNMALDTYLDAHLEELRRRLGRKRHQAKRTDRAGQPGSGSDREEEHENGKSV
jgi:hypothetical protein